MIHQCHNSINAHYHYVHHYIVTTQITSGAGVPFKCTVISWLKSDLHTLQFGLSILIIRFMALLDAVFSALHVVDCFDNVAFQVDHFLLGVLALVPALLVPVLPLLLFRAASKISTVITYLEHITESLANSDRPMNTDLS